MLPNSKETDLLGTELKRLQDKDIKKPFVFVDLRKWVPAALEISEDNGKSHLCFVVLSIIDLVTVV